MLSSFPTRTFCTEISGNEIANKAGDVSGFLEAGKDADFLVLDRNLFEVPITSVEKIQVWLSVVGGAAIIDKL